MATWQLTSVQERGKRELVEVLVHPHWFLQLWGKPLRVAHFVREAGAWYEAMPSGVLVRCYPQVEDRLTQMMALRAIKQRALDVAVEQGRIKLRATRTNYSDYAKLGRDVHLGREHAKRPDEPTKSD